MPDISLNPDGPHSPEATAEAASLFNACSRFLTYATMKPGGLEYPADAYRLLGEVYSATSRLPQMCEHLGEFLSAQEAAGRLYEARGRDIADQVNSAALDLREAALAARQMTGLLQAAQAHIAGLGVREHGDG